MCRSKWLDPKSTLSSNPKVSLEAEVHLGAEGGPWVEGAEAAEAMIKDILMAIIVGMMHQEAMEQLAMAMMQTVVTGMVAIVNTQQACK